MKRKFWYIVWCFVLLTGGGLWFFLTVGESGDPVVEIGAGAFLGGYIADKFIGYQRSILTGAVFMSG